MKCFSNTEQLSNINTITSYGIVHTSNIEMLDMMSYHGLGIGPSHCAACRTHGSFEGVFYGLCDACCLESDYIKGLDSESDHIKGLDSESDRIKTFKFIKEIQKCIADTRLDHPNDEYEIVKDAVDAGFYILDLYTKAFYARMMAKYNTTFCCCKECEAMVEIETIDGRGYCEECQNPEYDPVWPMGD